MGKPGGLLGGRLEVGISQPPATSFEKDEGLSLMGDFRKKIAGFSIFHHRAQGHFYDLVFTAGSETTLLPAVPPVPGLDMPVVFQVKEGPQLAVPLQDDVTAPTSVTPVRTAFRNKLLPSQMGRPGTPVSRLTENFYIIDKIGFRHPRNGITWFSMQQPGINIDKSGCRQFSSAVPQSQEWSPYH